MAFQLLLRSRRDDQVGDLRRQKPPQPAHAFDLADLVGDALFELLIELGELVRLRFKLIRCFTQVFQQSCVFYCDHCMSRKALQNHDLLFGE